MSRQLYGILLYYFSKNLAPKQISNENVVNQVKWLIKSFKDSAIDIVLIVSGIIFLNQKITP